MDALTKPAAVRTRLTAPPRTLHLLLLAALSIAAGPSAQPIVTVGGTAYGAAELERWARESPRLREAARNRTAASAFRGLVETEFVTSALLDEHAARSLGSDVSSGARDAALAVALEHALGQQIQISDEQVRDFFARHQDRYSQPEAVRIWRILVAEEATARTIIGTTADKRLGVYEWGNLAREHSTDKATAQRDGDLGFVRADGTTDVPELRVAPEIVAAASRLRDGEMLREPVPEQGQFAVVWRRGTRPARALSFDSQREHIRANLLRHELQRVRTELLERLRAERLRDHQPDAIELVRYGSDAVPARPRAAREVRGAASPPQPQQTDRGER